MATTANGLAMSDTDRPLCYVSAETTQPAASTMLSACSVPFDAQTATRVHRSELMQTDCMSERVAKHSCPGDM